MHPVVIMAYDKSPAINKAVAALEEAGMEVRVLNTGHAKLADFLGALAGEDDEDLPEEPKEEPTAEEEPKDDAPVEEPPVEEPIATESLKVTVDGEEIAVQLTEGASELHPNGLMVGSKTAYMLNESHFAFWPVPIGEGLFDLTRNVQVQFGHEAVYEAVLIREPTDKPVLRLNKGVYAKFREADVSGELKSLKQKYLGSHKGEFDAGFEAGFLVGPNSEVPKEAPNEFSGEAAKAWIAGFRVGRLS